MRNNGRAKSKNGGANGSGDSCSNRAANLNNSGILREDHSSQLEIEKNEKQAFWGLVRLFIKCHEQENKEIKDENTEHTMNTSEIQ